MSELISRATSITTGKRISEARLLIIVLWGVSGCGKSTVGEMLATRLGWIFYDADEFHPDTNISKMKAGIPLTDEDRDPWLTRLATLISNSNSQDQNAILACSALKSAYRDKLGINEHEVKSVYLEGDFSTIEARLAERDHAFMHKGLLASQFNALEPETKGIALHIGDSVDAICDEIESRLGLEQ
jgi:gluconokinase